MRSLVDPANPSTRSTPSTEQDLVIAAKHNHVLSFDNLSNIRPMMADAFCRIATGGGFGTRKLHTDTDEVLFNATRPCLLNGIPDLAARPDLADRSIGVTLPVISSRERRTLGSFNRDFAKAAPFILGALLDAVSTALSRIDSVSLSEAPRMADFAKWVVAAAPALGWPEGAFLDSYAANRETSDQSAIENNPVALAVMRLMGAQKHWEGTATDLKQTLRQRFPTLTDDPYSFPRQENKLSAALRRVQPPLRRGRIAISFERRGKSGERLIQITSI
ncbi:DNA-binding protein [Parasedimentitalea psychrophila]|uniref:DNA-binding protein n=1 Tax=Parasedimentitalea psychrophila TaxID=2997337 RepID=A0A9Y2P657_9RHOB|nr:DNA-binding protein [Parasedimentitalea psychrophila]WIY27074.1 DNA-binding protein [Parasedimentitalea psychrophila]